MSIYQMQTGEFRFMPGVVMNDILLADEINRTSPKTQASLLEAMEERQITIDGKTLPLPELFMVIATQNPVEQLGTYRLPEAQLDRFLMKISMGYPEKEKEEADIVRRALNGEPVKQLSPVTTREEIIEMKKELRDVRVHDDIMATPWKLHGIQEKADISPWEPAPGPPSLSYGPPEAGPTWKAAASPRRRT